MNTERADRSRDAVFVVGTIGGMLLISFGFAVLVLALSIGVRREQSYLSGEFEALILAVGALVLVAGVLGYLFRRELAGRFRGHVASLSRAGAFAGLALVLYGGSAHTTFSAPFLTSPEEKLVLFGVAYGLVGVGYLVLQSTARRVGWSA